MSDHDEKIPANSAAWRQALRRDRLAARALRSPALQRAAAARLADVLGYGLGRRAPATVGWCWPVRGEVDCRPAVERLLATGWQAVMPVVSERAAPMRLHAWWPAAPMSVDPYGIPVPATGEVPPPAVLLVPLLAYDAAGYRLGYGGGYFDRTLAALPAPPLTLGVGFAADRLVTLYPEPHDVPLHAVITENGLECFVPLDFCDFPFEDADAVRFSSR